MVALQGPIESGVVFFVEDDGLDVGERGNQRPDVFSEFDVVVHSWGEREGAKNFGDGGFEAFEGNAFLGLDEEPVVSEDDAFLVFGPVDEQSCAISVDEDGVATCTPIGGFGGDVGLFVQKLEHAQGHCVER